MCFWVHCFCIHCAFSKGSIGNSACSPALIHAASTAPLLHQLPFRLPARWLPQLPALHELLLLLLLLLL